MTDTLQDRQAKIVRALQDRVLTEAARAHNSSDLKDVTLSLAVAIDKYIGTPNVDGSRATL